MVLWRSALAVALLGALTVAGRAPAQARSRDFSAAPEPEEPTLPRSGPLALSLDFGVNTLAARWYDPNRSAYTRTWQLGPMLRLGAGFVIRERFLVSAEGYGAVPFFGTPGGGEVLRFGDAIALGGLGVGTDWFLREGGSWHLHLSALRCWSRPWGFLFFPGTQVEGDVPTMNIWLFEAGIGRARRNGHVDRSWIASLFGGPAWSGGQAGWTLGVSLAYSWSRS